MWSGRQKVLNFCMYQPVDVGDPGRLDAVLYLTIQTRLQVERQHPEYRNYEQHPDNRETRAARHQSTVTVSTAAAQAGVPVKTSNRHGAFLQILALLGFIGCIGHRCVQAASNQHRGDAGAVGILIDTRGIPVICRLDIAVGGEIGKVGQVVVIPLRTPSPPAPRW